MNNTNNRDKKIVHTSIISIVANLILVMCKAVVGFLSGSIAIVLDALNNLTDAVSSIITIIGLLLASKKPDEDHPMGHGRIEYLSAIIVSIIVIYAGMTACFEAIKKIFEPTQTNYSVYTILILVFTIVTKCVLGTYVKNRGKMYNSPALVGSGVDALNDCLVSVAVLVSTVIYMTMHIQLDAIVGLLIAILIMRSGFELLFDDLNDILGRRLDRSFTDKIIEEISKNENVLSVHDLILHNYGPSRYIGSVEVDIDSKMTASDISIMTQDLKRDINQKFGVTLSSIGTCSYDEETKAMRLEIEKRLEHIESIIQVHGIYIDSKKKQVYLDVVTSFDDKYPEETGAHAQMHLEEAFPEYTFIIHRDLDI